MGPNIAVVFGAIVVLIGQADSQEGKWGNNYLYIQKIYNVIFYMHLNVLYMWAVHTMSWSQVPTSKRSLSAKQYTFTGHQLVITVIIAPLKPC